MYADKKTKDKRDNLSPPSPSPNGIQLKDNRAQSVLQKEIIVPADKQQPILQKKANTTGLPDDLKTGIESLSGHSLDDVNVHYNSSEPAQLNAHAYAQGTNIHVAAGQEKHLPHEAWHVVQQKQGRVKPTMQLKDNVKINDDKGLEKEADVMGTKALNTATTQRAVKNTPAPKNEAPVIQRWLAGNVFSTRPVDKRISGLVQQAQEYNSNRKGKTRTHRINELHDLQVATMLWLDEFVVPDQNVSTAALWVKKLMNAVQLEHEELVEQSITKNDDTPPVANYHQLPGTEQKRVKATWDQLVNGTGNVQITETEDFTDSRTSQPASRNYKGFRNRTLAQFARLLETATGRDIVAQVNKSTNGEKLVTIIPGLSEAKNGGPKKESAASPAVMDMSHELSEVPAPNTMFKGQHNAQKKRDNYRKKFVELHLPSIVDPKLRAAAIYKARKNNPNAIGLKIGAKYYKFGAGTAVNVSITSDIRDSEDHSSSRFIDDNVNEIPVPNFITLAHELGHASHMLTGVSLSDENVSDQLFPQVDVPKNKMGDWSGNMEEYANIHSVENAMRGEYGMRSRYGHTNQLNEQKKRLTPIVNRIYNLTALLPQPHRAAVEDILRNVDSYFGNVEITPARAGMREAVTNLSGRINNAFPRFTGGETAAIKSELTSFKTNVSSGHADVLTNAMGNINQVIALIQQANMRLQQVVQQNAPQQGGGYFNFWPFV